MTDAPVRCGPDCARWTRIAAAAGSMPSVAELFAADPRRHERCTVEAAGLVFDWSRQRVSPELLGDFAQLADELDLPGRIAAQFRGAPINTTERRAVLHTALRRVGPPEPLVVEGVDVDALARGERERMLAFAQGVRAGSVRGSGGDAFTLVVNIGIGGSDLGPAMAVEALHQYTDGSPRVAFASNVDGCQLADLLAGADAARTLFIICSKTFTTLETRTLAQVAREWVRTRLGDAAVPAHFAAVSVNAVAMDDFGVHPAHRFALWDWVGGRYSIWSSVGVSLAIAIGPDRYMEFLGGASEMDAHFRTAPWSQNLPVLAAMLGVWNVNLLGLPTHAVLPYNQRLARLPAYLQQLEMESNGKSVALDGRPAPLATCPVIWGEPGSNAQHSFFQLLHQGNLRAACDLLLPARSSCGREDLQRLASANCLAQAEAFAYGQGPEAVRAELARQGMPADRIAELLPHKLHSGGRPCTLLMFERLDPATLGRIIALYEHKVFVQGVVWGVNSYDQWGVELGKKLCEGILPLIDDPARAEGRSGSLRGALAQLARLAGRR